ncbi:glycoside hydrolase 43 family protein [Sphingomonas sanguinis]|uniref:glycoside hydrolase family 43 protein n=1 Tax=Sphingomonas sp. LC-1 TaxID=3110957 RepID=UPI0021BA8CDC|nr:glycoside hydrolase 43 family protein [Sphingomonas sp. LC-1]MCT8000444.1 glycoside hydrolase 43 family protein [Sphingomonas sp. LC-1]
MRRSLSLTLLAATLGGVSAMAAAQAWQSDRGDGSYANPPLYADYPDPDIIRVGQDFYFITTTFANVPGLTIMTSRDLVNWRFVGHVIDRLEGLPEYELKNGGAYRKGIFAPSLRYHDGVFYIAVTPVGEKTRIYRSRDIRGPWQMNRLSEEAFDPGLFIDKDGSAYVMTSVGSDGTTTLLSLSRDLRTVTDKRVVYFNKGAEGSKIVRRGDYYYMFNAIPRRLGMTVSRARSLFGPWETRDQIDDKTGGHQGAIVDLPDGSDYGFVMTDAGAIGRMTNISPVFWRDGWPVWGTPDAPGRVPVTARKPIQGQPVGVLPASDDFSGRTLGLQWQWNHNPLDDRWSLTERPGYLRLRATQAPALWSARNTLLQKGQGPFSRGVVAIDTTHIVAGDQCGFGTFGKYSGHIAIGRGRDGRPTLTMRVIEDVATAQKTEIRVDAQPITAKRLFLRTDMDFKTDRASVAYSIDGRDWRTLGGDFPLAFDWRTGTFQGQQYALFCYNSKAKGGWIDVDSFTLSGR